MALLVAFVLRAVLDASGPELAREHWPGAADSLAVVLRLAGYEAGVRDPRADSASREG